MADLIDVLLERIKTRYSELPEGLSEQQAFLRHLESLARWHAEPMDYPSPTIAFPATITISKATCHPECGVQELIVDGGIQECQRCGSLLFRHSAATYRLEKADEI